MSQEYLCYMTDENVVYTGDERLEIIATNAQEALAKAEPYFLELGYSKTSKPFVYEKNGQKYHLVNNDIWAMIWGVKTLVYPTAKKFPEEPPHEGLERVFTAGENSNDGASSWGLDIYNYSPEEYLVIEFTYGDCYLESNYIIPKKDVDLDEIFTNIKAKFDSYSRDHYICCMSDTEIEYKGQKFTWP